MSMKDPGNLEENMKEKEDLEENMKDLEKQESVTIAKEKAAKTSGMH